MQAFKCDRCGVFYGKYKLTNEYSFHGAPIKVSSGDVGLDLCSDCRKKLIEFMKSGKENDIPKPPCCDPGFYQEAPEIDPLPYRIENAVEREDCKDKSCHTCRYEDGPFCKVNMEVNELSDRCHDFAKWEPKEE